MGVLDGFQSTWSKARATFGEGAPSTGEQFDQSSHFREMQATVESAAPGSAWTGSAATAYDAKNTKHAALFSEMAALDQKLSAKITESANVVTTGRQNLDNVRTWVYDAAAAVPDGKTREQMLLPIVRNGLGQVHEIVAASNAEFGRIGSDIKEIDKGWQALKGGQGPAEKGGGKGDIQTATGKDDEKSDRDENKKSNHEKSIGKGSDTKITPTGEPETTWGQPTDPHVWKDLHKEGTFDGDNGSWQATGPGRQGGANASEHEDGVTGHAGIEGWIGKAEGSWKGEILGQPVEAGAHGELLDVNANADGTVTDHGTSLGVGAEALAGEIGADVKTSLGPVDVGLGLAGQAGIGATESLDVGMQDGKLVIGGTVSGAFGFGGKISPKIEIDPQFIAENASKAAEWIGGLF